MKIACITTSVVPSSSANSIQAMKVVHALRELDMDVRLWVPDFQRAEWVEIADIYGLKEEFEITWLPFLPAAKKYDFCWNAVSQSIRWGADLIYTWSLQAAALALIRKKSAVMEFHDYPMGTFGPFLFRLFLRLNGNKMVLTTTRALARGIENQFNFEFSGDVLQIAPNGTDPERYADLPDPPQARQELGLLRGLTVGYSGHFYAGRGMDLLVDIARALPHINFLWIGGRKADILPWREKLVGDSIHNVTITGFIPNSRLPLYQAAAEILVMPYSRNIAGSGGGNIARVINPMKMFDYLAAGRAIVASDIPVFHEILNEEIAVFCEPENPEDWVKVIKDLSECPALIKNLGISAKLKAVNYTWKKRAQTTLNRFEKILE